MNYYELKETLSFYYKNTAPVSAEKLQKDCYADLDKFDKENPGLNNYALKVAQYQCIAKRLTPTLFDKLPYYFETGALHPFCDGYYGRGMLHANGWLINRNTHITLEENPDLSEKTLLMSRENLYTGRRQFLDLDHFKIPFKKIFEKGLFGVYQEVTETLKSAETQEEKDFLECAAQGLLVLKQIAESFAQKAEENLKTAAGEAEIAALSLIADTAKRVPWEKPQSVYEGLATLAFMRKVLGSIEGIGFNSMGRVDVLLYPLYLSDKKKGVSDEEIYDFICKFLLIWDAHIDKSKKMAGYSEYEYENGLTLGGCDRDGKEVFNEITTFFLKAHLELDNMYPKIKCRYSAKSSDAYLKEISHPLLKQKSVLLYCNDDVIIPALIRHGFAKEHAFDYTVSGCWDISLDDYYKAQCGQYVNALKALEWSMTMPKEKLEAGGLDFLPFKDCKTFDELYHAYLHNFMQAILQKATNEAIGGKNWSRISPFPITSALMYGPLEKRTDYTNGGGTYPWENMMLAAVPDTVDSLLAIKYLCFDKKVCTLKELLSACENNWENEVLRQMALHAPAYGDGSEESARFFAQFAKDIYDMTRDLPTSYGGKWQLCSYMYTEIIWWGKNITATPNGRYAGDFLSQGFTPSRLHKIDSVTDVFDGLRYFDAESFSGGTVINIVLPASKITDHTLIDFLRGCAKANTHIMQINCVDKETLLAAQREPEKHQDIIVRVCGFSAQFIALSEDFQNEFLSRNFYEG